MSRSSPSGRIPGRSWTRLLTKAFDPLARLIEGWKATAEIHATPDLAKSYRERPGRAVKVKRPKSR